MFLMAIHITKGIDERRVWVHVSPRKQRVRMIPFSFVFVRYLVFIPAGTKSFFVVKVNGVCPAFHRTNRTWFKGEWRQEKREQKEATDAKNPLSDLHFPTSVKKAVSLHVLRRLPNPLILFTTTQGFNDLRSRSTIMAETEAPRIGLKTGLQAGAFIGLFLGFSLAVVSALTQPDELERLVRFMCVTPLLCAVVLGPFLGWRRAPQISNEDPIDALRELLKPFNEGQGKWRVLSHVRSDGRTVRIDLHNSTQPLTIVAATLELTEEHPIRYIVGRGEARSRDPELRGTVLAYIEQHIPLNRRRRTSSSVEVLPPSIIEHMAATHRMHRRLFFLLPIILFFAWLEMR